MQRPKVSSLNAVLLLLLLQRSAGTQQAAATKGKSYFLMDANGSYRYAYDTGNGIEGAQSADPANEVTGHYTYVERGVPYTVRYRAGVKGYQPEVITAAGAAAPLPQTVLSVDRPAALLPGLNHVLSTFGSGHQINAPATRAAHALVNAGSASNAQPTLQFIAAALQSMQRQPLQLSFNSQHGQLQQLAANGGAASSTARPPTLISRADVAHINQLGEMPAAAGASTAEAPMRPYAFAYGSNADLSARSESADRAGNVVGKYSYRDEAGFHELAYKAGDDIGFQIVGGNLAQLNANQNRLESNSNQFQYGNSIFHSNLNKNKKVNSNINLNLNSNFNSTRNSKLNSNINSNLNLNINQNSNLYRLFTSNFNLNSYSNSNLNSNLIRNSNSNSFSHTSKQQSTPQLLVSVTHEPHGSYNYKVERLRHIVSNALKHPTEHVSRKF